VKNYFIVFLVSFAGFISAADNWITSLLLPNISESFNITISEASMVLTAYLIPYGIMQPVYGFYSDMYGKKKVLQLLMLCLSVATLMCSYAGSFFWLVVFRFITGFFAAGIISVSLGILGEFYKRDVLTKLVGVFIGIVFLGQGISSGVGGWLIEVTGWRQMLLIFSIMALISFMTIFLMPLIASTKSKNGFLSSTLSLIKDKKLSLLYILAFYNGFIVLGGYSFIGSYFVHTFHISYLYVGFALMLFGVVCFVTGIINKFLLVRMSKLSILVTGLLFSCVALILLSLNNLYLAYPSVMLLGMGYVFVQSILASRALDFAGENKGLSSGLIGVGIFGGGGVGTYLGGKVLHLSSYSWLFLFLAIMLLIPLLICNQQKKYLR